MPFAPRRITLGGKNLSNYNLSFDEYVRLRDDDADQPSNIRFLAGFRPLQIDSKLGFAVTGENHLKNKHLDYRKIHKTLKSLTKDIESQNDS